MLKVIFICVNDALLIKGKRKRREKYIKCNCGSRGERGHAGHVPSGTSWITYGGDAENKNKK